MSLPAQYSYLLNEAAPRVLIEGLKTYGVNEFAGNANNPEILRWATVLGINYTADSTAWCGLWMAYVVRMAGHEPIHNPLWARNWIRWGTSEKVAMLGDVLVFSRADGGGHVAIYIGEDATTYHVLGGNQSDKVNIMRIAKTRCIAVRRTDWRIAQPSNIRQIFVNAGGIISTNEA